MNTNQLIKEWITYAHSENNSELTIKSYKKAIEKFIQWLGNRDLTKIKIADIRDYKLWILDEQNLSPATFNQHRAALVSLYNFLWEHDYCNGNPVQAVKSAKLVEKYQGKIDIDKVHECLELLRDADHATAKRNYVAGLLALKLGLRAKAILSLTVKEAKKNIWKLTIKGGSERVIDITPLTEIRVAIDDYLKVRPECDFNNLFVNERNQPWGYGGIYYFVKTLLDKVGEVGSPHTCRRSLGDMVYSHTGDENATSDVLGHKSKKVAGKHYIDPISKATRASEIIRESFEAYR